MINCDQIIDIPTPGEIIFVNYLCANSPGKESQQYCGSNWFCVCVEIHSLSLYSISSLYIGAEFSGCRLGEVMSAAEINMSRLNALNSKLEIELASLEADEIRSSVKHQEEMRDKLRQKQSE